MNTNTQHVAQLLGQLAPEQLEAVVRLIEVLLDPVARSIANAPLDNEEITSAMTVELDAAHASIARGKGIPHEQVMRQFSLTPR